MILAATFSIARDASGPLSISARSGIIIDANSGAVLWSKNPDLRSFPASTTKIMTAMLLLQNRKLTDIMTAPNGIEKVPPSSMHLRSGEQLTVHDLLYAMLLRSANDAAVTIAYDLAGSRQAFANMMNQEAQKLGCTNTHFDNPNGLDDPDHWTTAADMAKIARAAMEIPFFRQVVSTVHYRITRSINQRDLWMTNLDKTLRLDPTADGIKTGWTVPAGHCFVGSATRDGFRVITVEFHSNNWVADNEAMMAWAFSNYKHVEVDPAGTKIAEIPIPAIKGFQLQAGIDAPLQAITPKGSTNPTFTVTYKQELPINQTVDKGAVIGRAYAWNQQGIKVGEVSLIALNSEPATQPQLGSASGRFSMRYPIGALFIVGGVVLYRRKNRMRNGLGSFRI